MTTVRIAKELGSIESLYPEGCDSLWDLPEPVFDAIDRGLRYVEWEDMDPKDAPPRDIWDDVAALEAHFKMVRQRHKAEAKGETPVDDDAPAPKRNALIDTMLVE